MKFDSLLSFPHGMTKSALFKSKHMTNFCIFQPFPATKLIYWNPLIEYQIFISKLAFVSFVFYMLYFYGVIIVEISRGRIDFGADQTCLDE